MHISFSCPSCGYTRDVDEELEGKSVRCPKCKAQSRVPDRKERARSEQAALSESAEKANGPAPTNPPEKPRFTFKCPYCANGLAASEVGKRTTCPSCGGILIYEGHIGVVRVWNPWSVDGAGLTDIPAAIGAVLGISIAILGIVQAKSLDGEGKILTFAVSCAAGAITFLGLLSVTQMLRLLVDIAQSVRRVRDEIANLSAERVNAQKEAPKADGAVQARE